MTRVNASDTLDRTFDGATLVLTGADRIRWLNGMVTADLTKLAVGSVTYALLVTKTGKIRTETWIASVGATDAEPARVLLTLPDAIADEVTAELDRYLVMDDVELNVTRGVYDWRLRWAATRLEDSSTSGVARAWIKRGDAFVEVTVDSNQQARADEDGAAWDAFRVEHFIPASGVDFDDAHYPQEAALEIDGVSFQKGCYLGQEAVFMLQHRGHVKKRLVQLRAADGASLRRGDQVTTEDGVEVGSVTSASGATALAMVKYKSAFADTSLRVAGTDARVSQLLAIVPEAEG